MATPFTYLLVAIAAMTTVYCTVAAPANARADDLDARAYPAPELVELVKWHSGLSVIRESCVSPEWKSALSAIDQEESMALHVGRGTEGRPQVVQDGLDSSAASFNAPPGGRNFMRGPGGTR